MTPEQGATPLLRDLAGLSRWSRWLLYAQALVAALSILVAIQHGQGFNREDGSPAYALLAALQLLLFIAAGFAILRWIYRANANAHALGAQGMGQSPAWAVGSYFVPIANLVIPFRSMREIWKASTTPGDWEVVKAPSIIGWWWFFWLTSGFASTASFRLDWEKEKYAGAEPIAEMLINASDLLTIAASLLLASIIGRVTAIQELARH